MKRILYLISILFLCSSCSVEYADGDLNNPDNPDLGVDDSAPALATLMYFTGTDLSYFFNINIASAKIAVGNGDLGRGRLLYFLQSSSTKAKLVELSLDSDGTVLSTTHKEYTNITSLSFEGINEVVADFKSIAEDCEYNLVISGHGTGWIPKSNGALKSMSTSGVANFYDNSIWEQDYTNLESVTRFMGSSNDGFFDITELRESLEATDTDFGYIIFDECFMSSIELLYELKDVCDYIVASPCEIMGNGFSYEDTIPLLFENNGTSFNLQGACEAYYDYYANYSFPSGCIAMTVTSELENLAKITKEINQNGMATVDCADLQAYERLVDPVFVDFKQYMESASMADLLTIEFQKQFDLAFPEECRLHTERFFANIGPSVSSSNNYDAYYTTIEYYSGVTTSEPSSKYQEDWSLTSWAEATR